MNQACKHHFEVTQTMDGAGRMKISSCPDCIREASQRVRRELEIQNEELKRVLTRSGFVRCDIPACNCGSWHQTGGLYLRFMEIQDAVEEAGYSTNGTTLLEVIKDILAEAGEEDDG